MSPAPVGLTIHAITSKTKCEVSQFLCIFRQSRALYGGWHHLCGRTLKWKRTAGQELVSLGGKPEEILAEEVDLWKSPISESLFALQIRSTMAVFCLFLMFGVR